MNKNQFVLLAADDDPNDRDLFQLAAVSEGAPVMIQPVADGQETVDYLQGNEKYADRDHYPFPDMVVLDLKMPRMTGLEVLDWMRGHPACRRLPTVMLSGSSLESDVEDAYQRGVNTYFVKPGDLHEYRKLIRVMLNYWLESQLPARSLLPPI